MLHLWTSLERDLPILIGGKKISVVFHFGSTVCLAIFRIHIRNLSTAVFKSSHVVNDIDIKSHLATSLLGSSKEIQKDRTENFIEAVG